VAGVPPAKREATDSLGFLRLRDFPTAEASSRSKICLKRLIFFEATDTDSRKNESCD
jgi:hypothetical protein